MNGIGRVEYELAYYDSAIHRFKHYATRTPHINQCPGYETKQSDGEVPVMLHFGECGVPDRVLSIGLIELNCVLMLN